MTDTDIRRLCAKTIREECAAAGVTVTRIILFGSQARGEARHDSDWDFLVCVDRELSFPQRAVIGSAIRTRLAIEHVSVDILIKSDDQVRRERNDVGLISYYALKEGVVV
jgi:uncharacterized protein